MTELRHARQHVRSQHGATVPATHRPLRQRCAPLILCAWIPIAGAESCD